MLSLQRRTLAEFVGTALLVAVVVGSGIAAGRLSPDDVGLQLLENSLVTALGLGALILAFGPVSGAHFNPVVSAADWLVGRSTRSGLAGRDVPVYALAQIVGAIAGAILADAMFDVDLVNFSATDRSAANLLLGEVVATGGLVFLILSLVRSGRAGVAPAAVGAYIGAAYWFTSSTSFANPAVTVGRAFTDTFAGIEPASVPGFVLAQILGGLLGLALLVALYPQPARGVEHVVVPPLDDASVRRLLEGNDVSQKPSVLFVCVHNAGRSQMAAGWLAHIAGERIEVRSAGSAPKEEVNPVAVDAMREVGIDIAAVAPKILTTEAVQASDVVVTMGCGDACPIFPGKRYEDWVLDDPAGQGLDAVRVIRDQIRRRIEALVEDLLAGAGT